MSRDRCLSIHATIKPLYWRTFPVVARRQPKDVTKRNETGWVAWWVGARCETSTIFRSSKRRSIFPRIGTRTRRKWRSALRTKLVREGMATRSGVSRATARAVETVVRDADIRMPLDLETNIQIVEQERLSAPLSVTRRYVRVMIRL